MTSPSIDITGSLAEAEAAYAGFSEIGMAHFWVGVCKAVDRVRQKTSRHKTQEKRKKASSAIAGENEHAMAKRPSIFKKTSIRKQIYFYDR